MEPQIKNGGGTETKPLWQELFDLILSTWLLKTFIILYSSKLSVVKEATEIYSMASVTVSNGNNIVTIVVRPCE